MQPRPQSNRCAGDEVALDDYPYAKNQGYHRGRSRTAAISKMEHFVIIVNGFQPLAIITKRSILDVAAVLDPPLYQHLVLSSDIADQRILESNWTRDTTGYIQPKLVVSGVSIP